MGVSGAFKESTDWVVSSKSRWLASSGGTVRARAVEARDAVHASVDRSTIDFTYLFAEV